MSSGDSSAPHPSTPPNATASGSGTFVAGLELNKAIQDAYSPLGRNFSDKDNDDKIKKNLYFAWSIVNNVISEAGDPNLKERLRDLTEFKEYVKPGSKREQELVTLLRSMAKKDPEVPWEDLFKNEAFFKPELEKKTDLATTDGVQ